MANTRKYPLSVQFLISFGGVLVIATACFYAGEFINYTMVALVLLLTVSFLAMLFEILPVLTAAVLSAVIWNFFFISPVFTFHIGNAEDALFFLLYFCIALVNAVLTIKIRKEETKARDKEEKEKTIQLYNTLLNSLSHELRTPIATIIGAVDILKENKVQLTSVQQAELLTEIDGASIRLNRQVENLLNMSRLESGILKPKPTWCDLSELIYSLIQKLCDSDSHKINFSVAHNLPLFKMDSGLVEQILDNILHNAVQYTPSGSTIEIKVSHQAEKGFCLVEISDKGPGFPEQEIAHVFDKFYRLPQSKTGGSGLGLSIVKGFVDAIGGRLELKNNKEGGAIFQIEIPAEASYINLLKNE